MHRFTAAALPLLALLLASCTTRPIAPLATPYISASGENTATVQYKFGKTYESEDGVPLNGAPLICDANGVYTVNDEYKNTSKLTVPADREAAVALEIHWGSGMWEKTCWPFVAFTPEKGHRYTVINERVGGKGIAMLWTGPGLQSCRVSVFDETGEKRLPVATRQPAMSCPYDVKRF